jgi:hypothetical protein
MEMARPQEGHKRALSEHNAPQPEQVTMRDGLYRTATRGSEALLEAIRLDSLETVSAWLCNALRLEVKTPLNSSQSELCGVCRRIAGD